MPGVMPAAPLLPPGDATDPKNIPPPIMPPPPTFIGISMPNLHFSASSRRSKQAVPMRGSWPRIMFSDTPLIGSTSAWEAASISTSTVSSNEQRIKAPVSCLLIPCLVMAIRWPLAVMTSHSKLKCR